MTKKKKAAKSMSQTVVGVGTSGMPAPVRNFLGSRVIAGLIVLCAPILFATGIVSVDFENGRPHFSFNKKKAEQAQELASEKIHDLKGDNDGIATNATHAIQSFIGREQPGKEHGDGESFVGNLTGRVDSFRTELSEGQPQQNSNSLFPVPHLGAAKESPPQRKGPLSSLRDQFDSRR